MGERSRATDEISIDEKEGLLIDNFSVVEISNKINFDLSTLNFRIYFFI